MVPATATATAIVEDRSFETGAEGPAVADMLTLMMLVSSTLLLMLMLMLMMLISVLGIVISYSNEILSICVSW